VRHGSEPGQVTLGGRRVRIRRPRVRSADGTQELPVPAYQAFASADLLEAEAELEALARSLERAHPGAAASPREGLTETLTITRLGVPPTLARTLRSTNSIESMIEICRDHAANVKRWQDGQMVLRWVAAGMGEARKQFRRVNGHLHLSALRAALDATIATVTPTKEDAA
jgi:putative transposase